MQHPRFGAADRQRLQLHFDAIRDAEITMAGMCSTMGLDLTALAGLETWKYNAHRTDEMVRLHMSLVAMAFACNYRRAASLQWGDPNDYTIYDVPANAERQWKFNFISHRMMSDGAVGSDASDPLAAQAHAEVDVARMQTLAAGLDHFKARGLAEQCFVMWTTSYAEGPSHSFVNVPAHHLGQRRRLPETGSVRRRRRHHQQPPAQHAAHRRPARYAHHGRGLRRRSGRNAGRRQALTRRLGPTLASAGSASVIVSQFQAPTGRY